jgi:hypothetical protein
MGRPHNPAAKEILFRSTRRDWQGPVKTPIAKL